MNWRKSSRCEGGQCVEAASWRKSRRSGHNGNCVEAGHGPGVVGVRDTTDRGAGPVLTFSTGAWEAFTAAVKAS